MNLQTDYDLRLAAANHDLKTIKPAPPPDDNPCVPILIVQQNLCCWRGSVIGLFRSAAEESASPARLGSLQAGLTSPTLKNSQNPSQTPLRRHRRSKPGDFYLDLSPLHPRL
ncbi:MAG TPA: hypothetical protein VNW54_04900 [Granulicella sp.]|nr:hypothetical protein [Granulicella sp.]